MKSLIMVLVIMAVTTFFLKAQVESEEKEVAKAVQQLRIAMIDANKSDLERLASDKLSYGHSGGKIENKKEFVEKIVSGKSDFVTIDLSNQSISISDNVAVVRHDLSATTNDSGKPGSVALHILYVWQKQDGSWKMLARQAVKKK